MTSQKKTKTHRGFRIFIEQNRSKISQALDIFFNGLKEGAKDTKTTTKIIQKFVSKEGIDKEDEKFLKTYVSDILKLVGIGIPFVLLPGATLIIPFIIRAAEKRNIDLIPSNFKSKPEILKKTPLKKP